MIADNLETVSKVETLRFFDKYIAKESLYRRKLSVQVFANQHMENYENPVVDGVSLIFPDKVGEFKQSMPLFPLPDTVDVEPLKLA